MDPADPTELLAAHAMRLVVVYRSPGAQAGQVWEVVVPVGLRYFLFRYGT